MKKLPKEPDLNASTAQRLDYIFRILDIADLRVVDVCRLTGISRQAIYRWKGTGVVADKIRLNIVQSVARRAAIALSKGELPITDKMKPMERAALLKKIIDAAARQ